MEEPESNPDHRDIGKAVFQRQVVPVAEPVRAEIVHPDPMGRLKERALDEIVSIIGDPGKVEAYIKMFAKYQAFYSGQTADKSYYSSNNVQGRAPGASKIAPEWDVICRRIEDLGENDYKKVVLLIVEQTPRDVMLRSVRSNLANIPVSYAPLVSQYLDELGDHELA